MTQFWVYIQTKQSFNQIFAHQCSEQRYSQLKCGNSQVSIDSCADNKTWFIHKVKIIQP